MNTEFTSPFGMLDLHRFPPTRNVSLQAWDSADEYLLNYVFDEFGTEPPTPNCIINDDFGALYCALANYRSSISTNSSSLPTNSSTLVTDSLMSIKAISSNITRNNIVAGLKTVNPFEFQSLTASYALVLIKIPKTLALLEDELISLQDKVTPSTTVIAAGKVTSVTKKVLALFEKHIGPTKTSLAKKKSRLIFAKPVQDRTSKRPAPIVIEDKAIDFKLFNYANVFCREQLDIGARFFLKHLGIEDNPTEDKLTVVDLGCGNGVLGISLLKRLSSAEVQFVDESSSAITSAKATADAAGVRERSNFHQSHILSDLPSNLKGNIDLILCNPPFHQNNSTTDEIAWQMFRDAKKHLSPEGELRIVANRQLNYMVKLKQLFSSVSIVARNKKFNIYRAAKR